MIIFKKIKRAQKFFLGVLFGTFYSSLIFASDVYQPVEWNDLQAKNWQPPLIQPDPSSEHAAHHVDPRSLVKRFNNQNIQIPGYLIPIKYEKNVVSEFILVPFLEEQVKTHMHHEANQMIYVSLIKGLPVKNRYIPILVEGQLSLKVTHTDEGAAGYLLSHANAKRYDY